MNSMTDQILSDLKTRADAPQRLAELEKLFPSETKRRAEFGRLINDQIQWLRRIASMTGSMAPNLNAKSVDLEFARDELMKEPAS